MDIESILENLEKDYRNISFELRRNDFPNENEIVVFMKFYSNYIEFIYYYDKKCTEGYNIRCLKNEIDKKIISVFKKF